MTKVLTGPGLSGMVTPMRIVRLVFLGAIGLVAAYLIYLAIPREAYFTKRVGELETRQASADKRPSSIDESVVLRSSTGLKVHMRVRRPLTEPDRGVPVLLLLGGHRTGRDAVDLVGTPEQIAFAAIDYPYGGDPKPDGAWASLRAVPDVQRAFLDSPPALSLALDWLLEQAWVDDERIELVGASLGVPFAAVAGAVDERFSRVWLLHGGGDNVAWVAHVGRKHIHNDTLRRFTAGVALLLVYGNSFDTTGWIAKTSPRPVVIVSACDDDYVPREAQLPLLHVAENEHVEFVWIEGQHIKTGRNAELDRLLDIVLDGVSGEGLPRSRDCDRPSATAPLP